MDAAAFCRRARAADLRGLSQSCPRTANLHPPRLWFVRLSAGVVSSRLFLARRSAAVESVQQSRPALPRAMEHAHPLPRLFALSAVPDAVVVECLLSLASLAGGSGHVLAGLSLDRQPHGCGGGRHRVCLQWPHAQCADVAQQHRGAGLDALGRGCRGDGLAQRRTRPRPRGADRHDADADRRARDHPLHLGVPRRDVGWALAEGGTGARATLLEIRRAGRARVRTEWRATSAVSRSAQALPSRREFRHQRVGHAVMGLVEFSRAGLSREPVQLGASVPARSILDLILLHRRHGPSAGFVGRTQAAPAARVPAVAGAAGERGPRTRRRGKDLSLAATGAAGGERDAVPDQVRRRGGVRPAVAGRVRRA